MIRNKNPILNIKNATVSIVLAAFLSLFSLYAGAADTFYNQLNVTDVEGESADLNRYQGRVVLLNFWATWCPPCIKEMPSMQRLQDQFNDQDFQVVAVNMGQSVTTVESFLMELDYDFTLPVYLDEKGQAFSTLSIGGMPSSFLLDRNGKIIERIVGAREWDHPANVAALKKMLKE